jgi:hypothetical protein
MVVVAHRGRLGPPVDRPSTVAIPEERLPDRDLRTEPVPTPVAAHVGAVTGTDLSGVRIHRDGETSTLARRMRARAFTARGEVHLPAHQGPLQTRAVQALVAHELTHVAQQRRLGTALPGEDSPAGRHLEAEAQAVERAWNGGAAPAAPAATRIGRAPAPAPRPSMHRGAPPTVSAPIATPPSAAGNGTASAPPPAPVSVTVQRAPDDPPAAAKGAPDLDLDDLARRLYGRLRSRLRAELLVDRERAGLLADWR